MVRINGNYYYPGTLKYSRVLIEDNNDRILVYNNDDNVIDKSLKRNLEIDNKISGLPITIYFPSGGKFVADDKNVSLSGNSGAFVSIIERNKFFLFFGIVLIPIMIYFFSTVIMPYGSKKIAENIPHKIKEEISQQYLQNDSGTLTNQSGLNEQIRTKIKRNFKKTIIDLNLDQAGYNLVFISSDDIGANALALPDGTILLTDDLVNLYKNNDDLLLAVLLHEIAHVEKNHGLTLVFQSISTALVLSYILGDITAINDIVITASSVLAQQSFSKKMEYEADFYAAKNLQYLGKRPQQLAIALEKLSDSHEVESISFPGYFASHPLIEDRISIINNIENQ